MGGKSTFSPHPVNILYTNNPYITQPHISPAVTPQITQKLPKNPYFILKFPTQNGDDVEKMLIRVDCTPITNITTPQQWAQCGEVVERGLCWEHGDVSCVCSNNQHHNNSTVGKMRGGCWVGTMLRACMLIQVVCALKPTAHFARCWDVVRLLIGATPNTRYKGHLYKGQLVKITTFTKQFVRDASLEASSFNFTMSLIKDTKCTSTLINIVPAQQPLHTLTTLEMLWGWLSECNQFLSTLSPLKFIATSYI